MNDVIERYFALRAEVFAYLGYTQDWRILPLDDCREFYWRLVGEGPGMVCYAGTEAELSSESGNYYECDIYTQRFLPRWVYRAKSHTMVVTNTGCDQNHLLQVFDNEKERRLAP